MDSPSSSVVSLLFAFLLLLFLSETFRPVTGNFIYSSPLKRPHNPPPLYQSPPPPPSEKKHNPFVVHQYIHSLQPTKMKQRKLEKVEQEEGSSEQLADVKLLAPWPPDFVREMAPPPFR